MDSKELSEREEGNAGDSRGSRRMVLDIDLNSPPSDEDMFNPQAVMGQENQGQATNVIDGVVEVISPREFEEAATSSRRNRRSSDGSFRGRSSLSDLRPLGLPDPETDSSPGFLLNNPLRRVQNQPSCLTPVAVPTFTCGICMDQLTEETSTKCGHIFCKKCIDKAIASQHKCPSCRQKLSKRDTIRVYLPKSD